jgi:hypothetical protein
MMPPTSTETDSAQMWHSTFRRYTVSRLGDELIAPAWTLELLAQTAPHGGSGVLTAAAELSIRARTSTATVPGLNRVEPSLPDPRVMPAPLAAFVTASHRDRSRHSDVVPPVDGLGSGGLRVTNEEER